MTIGSTTAVALTWNDIRARAAVFARDWQDTVKENAESQTFWNEFFAVFGVSRKRVATFEQKVTQLSGASGRGRIDVLWPGKLLAEHKTRGKDLDAAYLQATDYFSGLEAHELPTYVAVSDFARIRLYTVADGTHVDFPLAELPKHVERFGFMAGFQQRHFREQDPVNREAAERMALLHNQLEASGYRGHALELLLVRLLFLLFADDSGLFDQRGIFYDLLEGSRKDGSDLGASLARLFQVLDTPNMNRQTALPEQYRAFPYVNGELFRERIDLADFNPRMRGLLLEASSLDWGTISPAIFGSMFQGVMDEDERRALGAHYTSESNILKALQPLFLDEMHALREQARGSRSKLQNFLDLLPRLRFLDPACGCGNFLILAFRELRRLELDALAELHKAAQVLDISSLIRVHVGQFYGIEFEEFPAQIARVAMWLTDHQMNEEASLMLGQSFVNLPLQDSAHIRQGDALEIDWEQHLDLGRDVIALNRVYIVGNPPFIGYNVMTEQQHDQIKRLFAGVTGAGRLDYVSGWYVKSATMLHRWKKVYPLLTSGAALVSTNSITQGEQVAPIWGTVLNDYGLHIRFAHRTFKWMNEARNNAAVHCVIVGFGTQASTTPRLFDYATVAGSATERIAGNITPYLTDGPTVIVRKAQEPLSRDIPPIFFGSMPRDGGHLILQNQQEYDELLRDEPEAAQFVRPLLDGQDFLRGATRWCLWLVDAEPHQLKKLPKVLERIERVRAFRLESKAASTRGFARTPSLFAQIAHRETEYLAVPRVSSERREYVPMAFMTAQTIVNDLLFMVPNASLFHFGVMTSSMHMAWMRHVGGKMKSDYRYAKDLVYNTFPWPDRAALKPAQVEAVNRAAQQVLDARSAHVGSTLADLYDPLLMPINLRAAHVALDRAVERCYRPTAFRSELERLAFLLEAYELLTPAPLLMAVTSPTPKRRSKKSKAVRE
jgi:hypothetical protein